jgi:hypothetical protein
MQQRELMVAAAIDPSERAAVAGVAMDTYFLWRVDGEVLKTPG